MARLDTDGLARLIEELRPERDVVRGPTVVDLDTVKPALNDELDVFLIVCLSDAISAHRWITAFHALPSKRKHHCPDQ